MTDFSSCESITSRVHKTMTSCLDAPAAKMLLSPRSGNVVASDPRVVYLRFARTSPGRAASGVPKSSVEAETPASFPRRTCHSHFQIHL